MIAIAGSIAQRPGHGGHAWVFLQYLLGFRRLGYDVLFLDRLDPSMCRDLAGTSCGFEGSENLRYLLDILRQFELQDCFSLDFNGGEQIAGLPRRDVLERIRQGVLINVMGYLNDPEVLDAAQHRTFLDIDPGFGQMWQSLGLCRMFHGHDAYVTIGLNIGQPQCQIPTCGLPWITTPQPIVLEYWPIQPCQQSGRFTSVVSWRGPFGPVQYNGQNYGLRVHEFRRFLELPAQCNLPFELALDIDASDAADLARLVASGWSLVNPRSVAKDPARYQHYVQSSWAEFMVAKQMYVKAKSGWLSDRSICYLASGKPVLAQDTHLNHHLPTGDGLLVFSTTAEALTGALEISRNYGRHAQAARELAEAYFDSDKVLATLINKLGIG